MNLPTRLLNIVVPGLLLLPVPGRGDDLDDFVSAQMTWRHIPGMSISVSRAGQVVRARGYGLANVETGTPATAETVYKLGSLSKQFLAAGVLLLAQRGELTLDETVDHTLPDVPEAWHAITVRHLLSHTSGLPRDTGAFDPFRNQDVMDVVGSVYSTPLLFPPGSSWSYSNLGYYVLAEIVNRVGGRPWTDFVLDDVLGPAGLGSTVTVDPALIVPARASGYISRQGRLKNGDAWRAVRPSGGFASTVLDLAQWDGVLFTDVVLDSTHREMLIAPTPLTDGRTCAYGLGWFVDGAPGHRRIHHDGGVPGFSSDFERLVDDSLAVAVLANLGDRDLSVIALGIAARYAPEAVPAPEPAVPDDDPAHATRVRAAMESLAGGVVDETRFTPQVAGWLRADLERGFGDNLRDLGPIVALERLGPGDEGEGRYRCAYRFVTLVVSCAFDDAGRIARFSIDS